MGTCSGSAVVDCASVCGGSSVLTDCGCGIAASDPNTNCCANDGLSPTGLAADCAGVCAGEAVEDCAGVCEGLAVLSGCDNACASTAVVDCAGTCGGTVVVDCAGTCGGTVVVDCAGTCGGDAVDSNSDGICDDLAISQIGSNLPEEFSISQNFPNPFNPVTVITFDVAEMDEISLIVYDLAGKEVATLVSGVYTPGRYQVAWNAVNNADENIVSGMYIYRYYNSEQAITRKMLYLK
jgi:hypothetical protein